MFLKSSIMDLKRVADQVAPKRNYIDNLIEVFKIWLKIFFFNFQNVYTIYIPD